MKKSIIQIMHFFMKIRNKNVFVIEISPFLIKINVFIGFRYQYIIIVIIYVLPSYYSIIWLLLLDFEKKISIGNW